MWLGSCPLGPCLFPSFATGSGALEMEESPRERRWDLGSGGKMGSGLGQLPVWYLILPRCHLSPLLCLPPPSLPPPFTSPFLSQLFRQVPEPVTLNILQNYGDLSSSPNLPVGGQTLDRES